LVGTEYISTLVLLLTGTSFVTWIEELSRATSGAGSTLGNFFFLVLPFVI
jgi:hypothetical protein